VALESTLNKKKYCEKPAREVNPVGFCEWKAQVCSVAVAIFTIWLLSLNFPMNIILKVSIYDELKQDKA